MQKMIATAATLLLLAGCANGTPMASSSGNTSSTLMPSGLGAGSVGAGGSSASGAGTSK